MLYILNYTMLYVNYYITIKLEKKERKHNLQNQ